MLQKFEIFQYTGMCSRYAKNPMLLDSQLTKSFSVNHGSEMVVKSYRYCRVSLLRNDWPLLNVVYSKYTTRFVVVLWHVE